MENGCGVKYSSNKIISVVNDVVDFYGTGSDKIIHILTAIQKKLNYLPDEALIEVSRQTGITPGQISEISTFYPQFRHSPTGKHVIQVCTGTTCFFKGSTEIKNAFRDYLNIEEGESCSPDNMFSIEEVECLGVCAIAPAVRIDDKIYGNLKKDDIEPVIHNFIDSLKQETPVANKPLKEAIAGEIRVGIGSCCVAQGSKEVLSRIVAFKESKSVPVLVKPVGCTGACGFTPILDIISKDGEIKRYVDVHPKDVDPIMEENFGQNARRDVNSDTNSNINIEKLDSFLSAQTRIATDSGGILSPVSLKEYISKGGLETFKELLNNGKPSQIVDILARRGLKEKSSSKPVGEEIWSLNSTDNAIQTIICNSEENDTGSYKDRMLLETFPFKIIEGMLITGLATGIGKAIFHISDIYPLANRRIKNAISQYTKAGLLGANILDSGFSFDVIVIEGPGDFICGEPSGEFAGTKVLMFTPETFCRIPNIIRDDKAEGAPEGRKTPNTLVVGLTGRVNTPGVVEVAEGTSIEEIIDCFGGGEPDDKPIKGVHVGGLAGCFLPKDMFDLPLDYDIFNNNSLFLGPGNIEVLNETDSIVTLTRHFIEFAGRQSCGKCTICRAGTKRMYNILQKLTEHKCTRAEMSELETLCSQLKKGSLCGLGKNAPNAVVSALKYFRSEFEECLSV